MKISGELYYAICRKMVLKIKPFRLISFSYINTGLLTGKQYFSLVEIFINRVSKISPDMTLKVINPKKLSKNDYFTVCKKTLAKSWFAFEKINAKFLTYKQYYELCLNSVKKSYSTLDNADKTKLKIIDWHELCKIAVKKKGSFLYYLDIKLKKYFCELLYIALLNGGGLKYLVIQYYSQNLTVLKKNGLELRYVIPEQFTKEQYYNLCRTAIKNKSQSLDYADDRFLDNAQYLELCETALNDFLGNIRHINEDKIPCKTYQKWCKKAVKKNPYWIDAIPPDSEQYYALCFLAVKKDGSALKNVKQEYLSKKQYAELKRLNKKSKK